MYSKKDTSPNYIEFSKNQARIGRFVWFQKPYKGKFYFEPCFQLLKITSWDNLKSPKKSIFVKKKVKRYRQSRILLFTMLKTLDSYLYRKPNPPKNQLWIRTWRSLIEYIKKIATYKMRRMFVTMKKYSVNKPPNIQIRLFTAKENEAMKQVAYVNYTLNEFKELPNFGRFYVC